jgi:GDPmannose 4,6-dehydratase
MGKRALITGITGQAGSYLAELLLSKGYEVHGLRRRASSPNIERISHLYQDPHNKNGGVYLHYGDITDSSNLVRLVQEIQPDEVYNLAAQSHVRVSFETPEYTANVDAIGILRLLEAVRILGMQDHVRIYQASTSEIYGNTNETPQKETSPFRPVSPYGVAKLYAYWITVSYRQAYGMFCCNGILFNHESPRRDPTFVTRKITTAVSSIAHSVQDKLYLGNLNAKRDWGYAPDFVQAMWLMLQQPQPDDYVIATGEAHSVREFVTEAFAAADMEISWQGSGVDEVAVNAKSGEELVVIDPWYFRPNEIDILVGDYSKAREKLNWAPSVKFRELVHLMVEADMKGSPSKSPPVTHLA